MAPSESRFADMPMKCRQIKANNNESGIIMETIRVVRQLNIKSDTTSVTNRMPSSDYASRYGWHNQSGLHGRNKEQFLRPGGNTLSFSFEFFNFSALITLSGFSPFRIRTMASTASSYISYYARICCCQQHRLCPLLPASAIRYFHIGHIFYQYRKTINIFNKHIFDLIDIIQQAQYPERYMPDYFF